MSKERRRRMGRTSIVVAVVTAIATISIPATAAAQVNELLKGVDGLLGDATGGATADPAGSTGQAAPDDRAGSPPSYTPPLHGTQPHGQGTVAVGDLNPSTTAPLGSDPAVGDEEIVVGDSAGYDNGTYQGRVSTLGLKIDALGINTYNSQPIPGSGDLLNTTTNEGETKSFAPLQPAVDSVCTGLAQAAGCVVTPQRNSASSATGSSNSSQTAGTNVGVPGTATATTGVVSSQGNISESGGCQTANGSSNVANANVGIGLVPGIPAITADALTSSSSSQACNNGTTSQSNSSNVLNLQGVGIGVPNAGCGNGTADTDASPPAPLNLILEIACNANESNEAQAGAPYGVREALTLFALNAGNPVLKLAVSGPESRAVAPATPTTPTTPTTPGSGTKPDTGGAGNPGGGAGDGSDPGGPAAANAQPGDGQLAFTGSNLILLALIGGSLVCAGIALAGTAGRHRRATA